MFRLLAFIFIFFSFSASSSYFKVVTSDYSSISIGDICITTHLSEPQCPEMFPDEYQDKPRTARSYTSGVNPSALYTYFNYYNDRVFIFVSFLKMGSCNSYDECYPIAKNQCDQKSKIIADFNFISVDNFTYSCNDDITDNQLCQNTVTSQCSSNGGYLSSNLIDDGTGVSSCSGLCGDGTISGSTPPPDCSVYPFCDVSDENNSDLDFSSGSSGSDVLPPSSSSSDTEHDIPYEPDGSTSDNETPFSTLQGDKLINEVVKSRNVNSEKIIDTTKTTNETIVEKSDDISQTISNSSNGIIDAINDIPQPSSDSSYDDSDLLAAIEDIGSDSTFNSSDIDFDSFGSSIFGDSQIQTYQSKIVDLKSEMQALNTDFASTLKANTSFLVNSGSGYEANLLDLGKWGDFDISVARFSSYFGGVGNIVMFLAALAALSIVLGGIRL